ncbi:protamine [Gracilaria domingensis]|nr:protamine [Gracilaria domingensis]
MSRRQVSAIKRGITLNLSRRASCAANFTMDHGRVARILLLVLCLICAATVRPCQASVVKDVGGNGSYSVYPTARHSEEHSEEASEQEEVPQPWELINVAFYIDHSGCDIRELENSFTARSVRAAERRNESDDDYDRSNRWDERQPEWESLTEQTAKEKCYISSHMEREKCCTEVVKQGNGAEGVVDEDELEECMEEGGEYFEWLEEGTIHLDEDGEHFLERELKLLSRVVDIQMSLDGDEYTEAVDVSDDEVEEAKDKKEAREKVKKAKSEAKKKLKEAKEKQKEAKQKQKEAKQKQKEAKQKQKEAKKEEKKERKARGAERRRKQAAKKRYRDWMKRRREEQKQAEARKQDKKHGAKASSGSKHAAPGARALRRYVLRMKSAELAALADVPHALPAATRGDYGAFRAALRRCYDARLMGTFYQKAEQRWMACTMLRASGARVGYCADLRELDARDERLRRAPVHCFEAGRMALLRAGGAHRAARAAAAAAAARQAAADAATTGAGGENGAVFVDLFNSAEHDVCLQADLSYTCYALCCDTMYQGSHFCRDSGTTCLG